MSKENHLLTIAAAPRVAVRKGRRRQLEGKVATRLLPLVQLLDSIQPHLSSESVFHTRRQQFQLHLAQAYAELRAEQPRHRALAYRFRVLAEVVREETQTIGPDDVRRATRELVLATLRNAPALLSAAQQARLLS